MWDKESPSAISSISSSLGDADDDEESSSTYSGTANVEPAAGLGCGVIGRWAMPTLMLAGLNDSELRQMGRPKVAL